MMNKKGLGTLLLTGALLVSANTSVFAADPPTVGNGTEGNDAKVSITKNVEYAEGITGPTATFDFTATPTNAGPKATIASITYETNDYNNAVLQDGKYKVPKKMEIVFEEFDHAGVYEYDVTETQGAEKGFLYSTKNYKLRVYVENNANGKGTFIQSITAEESGKKQSEVEFTNTYTKKGGGDAQDALVIEKKTEGKFADKTKEFRFKLKLEKAATTVESEVTGKIGQDDITFEYGVDKEFTLSDKEQLVFSDLPAGTRYVVTEVGVEDGYVPTVNVIENGAKNPEKKGNDKDDLTSVKDGEQSNLVGENENKVVFVNDFSDGNVPITGIIENNMPFILLIGVGASAFGVLAAAKKRKKSEA